MFCPPSSLSHRLIFCNSEECVCERMFSTYRPILWNFKSQTFFESSEHTWRRVPKYLRYWQLHTSFLCLGFPSFSKTLILLFQFFLCKCFWHFICFPFTFPSSNSSNFQNAADRLARIRGHDLPTHDLGRSRRKRTVPLRVYDAEHAQVHRRLPALFALHLRHLRLALCTSRLQHLPPANLVCQPQPSHHSMTFCYRDNVYYPWSKRRFCIAISTKFFYPLCMTAKTASLYIMVLITIERWIAVCKPLQVHIWCTFKNSVRIVIAIIVFSIVLNLPKFFEYQIGFSQASGYYPKNGILDSEKHWWYFFWYFIVISVVFDYLLPFVIMFIANMKVIQELSKTRKERALLTTSVGEHFVCVLFFIVWFTVAKRAEYNSHAARRHNFVWFLSLFQHGS